MIVTPNNTVSEGSDGRPRRRIALLLTSIAVLAVLGGCGGQPAAPTSESKQQVDLTFTHGGVGGGVTRIPVHLGATVDLTVTSDVTDEVHLHGYNRLIDVTAGQPTKLEFVANIPGVFDVELEQRGVQLAQLEIS